MWAVGARLWERSVIVRVSGACFLRCDEEDENEEV